MTPGEATAFGWEVALPLVKFVMVVALYLLGLALLRMVSS